MSEFSVKIRGVRGSYPVADKRFLKYGGNTACVEINANGNLIIIDAGTGLIGLGNELLQKYVESGTTLTDRTPVKATFLLSHIHQDHIQGFPFFRPLHVSSSIINVFGEVNYGEKLEKELADLLFTKTFPVDLGDIGADLKINDIDETSFIIIKNNSEPQIVRVDEFMRQNYAPEDIIISSYKSYAHPQQGVMIYKIEYKGKSVVYASDKESYIGGDKKLAKFAKNCNLLIHDAQYSTEDYSSIITPKQGFGHSTFEMAREAKKQINAEKLVYFHYDPSYTDEKLDTLSEQFTDENTVMGYEGLEINLL